MVDVKMSKTHSPTPLREGMGHRSGELLRKARDAAAAAKAQSGRTRQTRPEKSEKSAENEQHL